MFIAAVVRRQRMSLGSTVLFREAWYHVTVYRPYKDQNFPCTRIFSQNCVFAWIVWNDKSFKTEILWHRIMTTSEHQNFIPTPAVCSAPTGSPKTRAVLLHQFRRISKPNFIWIFLLIWRRISSNAFIMRPLYYLFWYPCIIADIFTLLTITKLLVAIFLVTLV